MRGKEAGRADGKKDVVIGERKEQKRKRKSASGAC
jgi:hypothetical protein